MKHLGDITQIKGNEAPTVDCIIGGSPCQDLSLAGKRAGLAGARSGLYMEQIRIIKEMRAHDRVNGRTGVDVRPRYMVWENVPGAFSTNQGQDFAAVLEEAIRVAEPQAPSVPVPEKGWSTAGCIVGEQWSVAWRVLDAQFWGTPSKPLPQRRRRIALVADFGGLSASEILFVRKSVSGDIEPGKQKGKETAGDARESSAGAIPCTLKIRSGVDVDSKGKAAGKGALIQTDKTGTLSTVQDQYLFKPVAYGFDPQACRDVGQYVVENMANTLTNGTNPGWHNGVCYGIGAYHSNAWKSDNPNSGVYEADTSKTLDSLNCGYPACNQGGMAVVQPTVCLEGNGSRPSHKGDGYIESDTMYTLNTIERHGVAYSIESHPQDSRVNIDDSGKVQTLTSRMGTGGGNVPMVMEPYCIGNGQVDQLGLSKKVGTLNCMHDQQAFITPVAGVDCRNATEYPGINATLQSDAAHNLNSNNVVRVKHIVRRLTPLECERLQGYPDGWTDIGEWIDTNGKKHKEADSPRYKALGNSIALPPWKWVLKRLCACYERDATLASLFDGIGGFPYLWEQINGKGSCLWASEIEEFPIAVTKLRFGLGTTISQANESILKQVKVQIEDDKQSLWIDGGGDFKCPACGEVSEYATKHCPECGEKLITGGNNDESNA